MFVSIQSIFSIGVSSGSISKGFFGAILRLDFGWVPSAVYLNYLVAFLENEGNSAASTCYISIECFLGMGLFSIMEMKPLEE